VLPGHGTCPYWVSWVTLRARRVTLRARGCMQTGYLIGSIEGRVAVQHIEENLHAKNFTFK
jgi:hypothetical protein